MITSNCLLLFKMNMSELKEIIKIEKLKIRVLKYQSIGDVASMIVFRRFINEMSILSNKTKTQ